MNRLVMVNFPGRNGRRRRVLNEEVLSASGARAARQTISSSDATSHAPRYSDAAGVENHPQITDFVPRKYRTIGMLVATGVVATATLGALHYFAPAVAAFAGLPTLRPFDIAAPGSIASWVSAVVLFMASMACMLVYSIRRHRIDDIRGRYRVWLGASIACFVLSANSVAGLHHVAAYAVSHFAGWTALRDNAVWWIAIAGLPLAWIGLRAMLDVRECRLAGMFLFSAAKCFGSAAYSYFGFLPETLQEHASLFTGASIFLGHWFILATVVTYARFVVLDAQGLIAIRRPAAKKQPRTKEKPAVESKQAEKATVLSVVNYAREKAAQSKASDDKDRWIDGSRPERKSYDSYDHEDAEESDGGKLSKADRKRLRKLKAQNRAA